MTGVMRGVHGGWRLWRRVGSIQGGVKDASSEQFTVDRCYTSAALQTHVRLAPLSVFTAPLPRLHDTTCCQTGCTTRFDNRLYRVNGV